MNENAFSKKEEEMKNTQINMNNIVINNLNKYLLYNFIDIYSDNVIMRVKKPLSRRRESEQISIQRKGD